MALNQVSVVPAGVLRVISDGFLTPTRAFSKGAPHHFPKAHALRYGHRQFGDDRVYIRWEWALRRWRWIKFQRYRLWCLGWFQTLFLPIPVHFRIANPYLFRKHMPWDIRTAKFGMIRCIFVEKLPLKVNFKQGCKKPTGVLMVIWSGFFAHTRAFSKGSPHHFQKAHALRYRHRKFGNDQMYIRGEWALRRWHWIKFQWYRLGC